MNIFFKKWITFIHSCGLIGALIILPHCARYQPTALLRPLSRMEKGGVEMGVKELTKSEFRQHFDSNLSTKTFIPLQLYIKNKTATTYILDPDNISLPIESPRNIGRQLYRNTVLRVAIWAIPGQLFWPCNIPAIVDGVYSHEANKAIDDDMQERGFGASYVEIKPRTSFNRIFFIHKSHYRPTVSVRLEDFDNKAPLEFTFELHETNFSIAHKIALPTPENNAKILTAKEKSQSYSLLKKLFTSTKAA